MKKAIVEFPGDYSYSSLDKLKGYIIFTEYNCYVKVEVNLSGLPPGTHGFHIHEKNIKQEYINDLKRGKPVKNLCETLGGHFNPFGTRHGSYKYNTERHAGDLINNLDVPFSGKVYKVFADPLISLNENKPNCILNRSIVIHETADDEGLPGLNASLQNKKLTKIEEESLKTGNAGKRIACGNITQY
jgi:superoxide dismutase, Cu-Zn family